MYLHSQGSGVVLWLRRCATSRTVPGSIPSGVTGVFSDIFSSNRTVTLGSTQPLVKMSTRNIPGGKVGRCVTLTTSHLHVPNVMEIWEPKSPGTFWATPGLLRDSFTFTLRTQSNTTLYFLPYWLLVSAITAITRPILYKNLKMLFKYRA
jgi:hypothetical protein